MGASDFYQIGFGKDANQAFALAAEEAGYEHGHGYSGSLAEKYEFILVTLPPRQTVAKLLALLEERPSEYEVTEAKENVRDWSPGGFRNRSGKVRGWKGQVAKAQRELKQAVARQERFAAKVAKAGYRNFDGIHAAYDDKWGPAVCVELTGAAAKQAKARHGYTKRGVKVFAFFGYASS